VNFGDWPDLPPRGENQSIADWLAHLPEKVRDRAVGGLSREAQEALFRSWGYRARPKQLDPEGDHDVWALVAGRGAGKTKAGAEWILDRSEAFAKHGVRHLGGLIGRTSADVRDVMVDGPSGVMACADKRRVTARHTPSRREIVLPELDTRLTTYSAEEPESLRGPEHHTIWADEAAAWAQKSDNHGNTAWTNMELGLRGICPDGMKPRCCVTTTPKPVPLVKDWFADETGRVAVTQFSMLDNLANLAPGFVEAIVQRYQHSALGRQEIYGLLVTEVEGALWRAEMIDHVTKAPDLAEIVVAVDPHGSSTGAECGIVVVGIEAVTADPGRRHAYVLEDCSIQGPPEAWGAQAVAAYHRYGATYILGEVNFGGEMVGSIIRIADPAARFKAVRVGRGQGKWARAEPVAALYQADRCHHQGYFPELESQMCTWVDGDSVSPDRMDALCHGIAYLLPDLSMAPASAWSPASMRLRGGPSVLSRHR